MIIVIETKRFLLRTLKLSDVNDRYLSWIQDDISNPYIETAGKKNDLESLKEYVSTRINRNDCIFLGIFLKGDNEHIGNIKFEPVDKEKGNATVGIIIGEQLWRGKGVAEEVITASAEYLYSHFSIKKVLLGVDLNNKSAIRAYQKSGFRPNVTKDDSFNESTIKMVRCHSSALRLAIGTAQFGFPYGIANKNGQISSDQAEVIIRRAWDSGVDTLDTAISYGSCEERLGQIGISNWRTITKLPKIPDDCIDIHDWIFSEVRQSLARLNIEHIYGLLLHKPDQLMDLSGDSIYKAIESLKKENLVKKIGISIYDPYELDKIWPRFQFDIVQSPFNIFDRRLKKSGWLTRLYNQGVEIHARSIFLQGLLLMNHQERPNKFNKWYKTWNKWEKWLVDNNLTPLHACLAFVISHPEFNRVIIGIDNKDQLVEILKNIDLKIPNPPEFLEGDVKHLINPSLWDQV